MTSANALLPLALRAQLAQMVIPQRGLLGFAVADDDGVTKHQPQPQEAPVPRLFILEPEVSAEGGALLSYYEIQL